MNSAAHIGAWIETAIVVLGIPAAIIAAVRSARRAGPLFPEPVGPCGSFGNPHHASDGDNCDRCGANADRELEAQYFGLRNDGWSEWDRPENTYDDHYEWNDDGLESFRLWLNNNQYTFDFGEV